MDIFWILKMSIQDYTKLSNSVFYFWILYFISFSDNMYTANETYRLYNIKYLTALWYIYNKQ